MNIDNLRRRNKMYSITVKYGRVEDVVRNSSITWITNDDITTNNFPNPSSFVKKVKVEIVEIKKMLTTEKVLGELDRMGYRPANIYELLAFGKKYPHIIQQQAVVALGSVWHHFEEYGEFKTVPALRYDLCWYYITLYTIWSSIKGTNNYFGNVYFLVMKKEEYRD